MLDTMFHGSSGLQGPRQCFVPGQQEFHSSRKNRKASSTKRTKKHVNICCFFITNQSVKNELSVVWCPASDVIGDHATKPLQGAAFKKFRDFVMGGVVPVADPGTEKLIGKSVKKARERQAKGLVTASKSGTTGVCWDLVIPELNHLPDAGCTGLQKDVRPWPAQETGNQVSMQSKNLHLSPHFF
jgi:hypothetical protein